MVFLPPGQDSTIFWPALSFTASFVGKIRLYPLVLLDNSTGSLSGKSVAKVREQPKAKRFKSLSLK